jgi:hypothetical protein
VGQPKAVVLGLRNRRYPSSNLSLNQPMPACPLLLTPTFLPSLRLTLLLLSLVLTAYRSLPFCYCDDKQASDTLSRYFCRNLQKEIPYLVLETPPCRVSTPEISARVVPSHSSLEIAGFLTAWTSIPEPNNTPVLLHSLAQIEALPR